MSWFTRRRFVQTGLAAGGMLGLHAGFGIAHAAMGGKLVKYLEPLPRPGAGIVVARPGAKGVYTFTQRAILRQLHPQLPPTPLWAYDDGSGLAGQAGLFGMMVQAQSGTAVGMKFNHALPGTYPDWIPVDTRLTPLGSQVRTLTHLHGAFVGEASDGNPSVSPQGFGFGQTQSVLYPNPLPQSPATMLWFHDHSPGATRLNVFAGLAGAYILRDAFDTGAEPNPIGIPGGDYEIPLVLQDRQFNPDGTMLYPRATIPGVTWIGEYFGDVMLVNGKAWPFLQVEPRMYRFRVLNACSARILNLDLGGAPMWQIGADGGLFDKPVAVRQLVLAPAERADVIVDFSRLAGNTLVMQNQRPPVGVVSPGPTLLQAMEIRVGTTVTRPGPASIPASLPGRAANLPAPAITRFITLNEIGIDTADWMLNFNGQTFMEPVSETPKAGAVEDWVLINLTGDTHPIHVHLVQFQIVGRTPFDAAGYAAAYGTPSGVPGGIDPAAWATGVEQPALPEERGYKDTVKVNPGTFTRLRAKFELPAGVRAPQRYVYHCHILEHEDNDMMRPFTVTA